MSQECVSYFSSALFLLNLLGPTRCHRPHRQFHRHPRQPSSTQTPPISPPRQQPNIVYFRLYPPFSAQPHDSRPDEQQRCRIWRSRTVERAEKTRVSFTLGQSGEGEKMVQRVVCLEVPCPESLGFSENQRKGVFLSIVVSHSSFLTGSYLVSSSMGMVHHAPTFSSFALDLNACPRVHNCLINYRSAKRLKASSLLPMAS